MKLISIAVGGGLEPRRSKVAPVCSHTENNTNTKQENVSKHYITTPTWKCNLYQRGFEHYWVNYIRLCFRSPDCDGGRLLGRDHKPLYNVTFTLLGYTIFNTSIKY